MMDTTSPNHTATVRPSPMLQRKVAGVRRKQTLVSAGSGLAAAVIALVVLLAAQMLADWWFDLPWAARAGILAADLLVLGAILFQEFVSPLRHPPDDDEAALLVEKHAPDLRSRLIAAIQLPRAAEGSRSPTIVAKLIAETEAHAVGLDFGKAVSSRVFTRFTLLAVLVTLLAAEGFRRTQPESSLLLKRVLLSTIAVPRKTQVKCLTAERTVARGESLLIEAIAHGVVPLEGKLEIQHASGRAQKVSMLPNATDRARFGRNLDSVMESFTYRVRLNDGLSESYRVLVEPQPSLASLKCVQVYPAYTGLGQTARALGDLTLLAGSRLQLEAVATKPIQQALIRLAGDAREIPLRIDAQTARNLTGAIDIPAGGVTGFSVLLLDQRGLRSRDEVVYRIDIVPDRAPTVSLTHPTRKEELVTAQGQLLIAFEASDDFGIGNVAIHYKAAGSDEVKSIPLDLEGKTPKTLRRRYEWKLAELQPPLAEGASLEYWIEARDGNDVTGPGVTLTDRFFAKVVSETEKRADLMGRLDDFLNTLGGVAESQQKLNEGLGELIRQRTNRR